MQYKLLGLMKERGVHNTFMSELINCSSKQFGKKINGKAPFYSDEMFIIGSFFDMNLEDIFVPRVRQNGAKYNLDISKEEIEQQKEEE